MPGRARQAPFWKGFLLGPRVMPVQGQTGTSLGAATGLVHSTAWAVGLKLILVWHEMLIT